MPELGSKGHPRTPLSSLENKTLVARREKKSMAIPVPVRWNLQCVDTDVAVSRKGRSGTFHVGSETIGHILISGNAPVKVGSKRHATVTSRSGLSVSGSHRMPRSTQEHGRSKDQHSVLNSNCANV